MEGDRHSDCIEAMYAIVMADKEKKRKEKKKVSLSEDDVHRIAREVVINMQKPESDGSNEVDTVGRGDAE